MKRFLAAALTALLCVSLCSCGYNPAKVGYVIASDGTKYEITCGRYLAAQFTAADAALYSYDATGSIPLDQMIDKEIDGKPVRQWIADTKEETLIRAFAVDRLADELGIELNADEKYVYEYYIGYGWSNYYSIYMANGIGYDSYYDYQMNMAMDNVLYSYMYGNGGKMEIEDSVVQEHKDTAAFREEYILCPYTPTDSSESLNDEGKQHLKELADQLFEEAKVSGLKDALEKFRVSYENILGTGCCDDALVEDLLIVKGDSVNAAGMDNAVMAVAEGEYGLYDAGDRYYVFRRLPLKDTDTLEVIREKVADILGPEMYEEYLKEYIKGWTVDLDQRAAKYYSVDKVNIS